MFKKKLFYCAFFSFFFTPYLLAEHYQESNKSTSKKSTLIVNSLNDDDELIPNSGGNNSTEFTVEEGISNYNRDKDLLILDNSSPSDIDSSIKTDENTLKINQQKVLKWTLLESDDSIPKDIEWLPIDIKNPPLFDRKKNNKMKKNTKLLHQKLFDFKLLKIGRAVPTSETLSEGQVMFNLGQVSPISSGYAKGTGNQNYLGEIDYALRDNFLLSFFYSDADDPLTKRIYKLDTQPENRWSSFGSSFKWKFLEKNQYQIAVEGSLENWMVQSGGCAGIECSFNSSNIFNSDKSMVENNNLVGSISFPIGFKYSSTFDFTISPKLTFLPGSQSNKYGEGDFYGNNYGIGFGMQYKALDRLKTFSSYYLPIANSKNSFDEKLDFSKTSIYTIGMNYAIDSRTNFLAYLSNGFGFTPATSVLTIPSSDEILYGFNIIYTPNKLDNYYYDDLIHEQSSTSKFFKGLSVSNNSFINSESSQINFSYDANGSWYSRYEKALSQRFIIDITSGSINKEIDTDSNFKSYFSPGNTILRGGAKAILYSNNKGNLFTTSLRGSVGRVLAESKPGYFFVESINSYDFPEKVSFSINPKIGVSGSGESIGLGAGLHWNFLPEFTLISETNVPIKKAENNLTFAIRYSPEESYKHIDLYTSNAFSFIDMGQLMRANKNRLGVNVGVLF